MNNSPIGLPEKNSLGAKKQPLHLHYISIIITPLAAGEFPLPPPQQHEATLKMLPLVTSRTLFTREKIKTRQSSGRGEMKCQADSVSSFPLSAPPNDAGRENSEIIALPPPQQLLLPLLFAGTPTPSSCCCRRNSKHSRPGAKCGHFKL